jgi:predicted enzyme related to lactoylglutathione lyase
VGTTGEFNWIDIMTTDQAAGKAFYQSLFRWASQDYPSAPGETYTQFRSDGKFVAGLGEIRADRQAQGMRPAWSCYVTVDDAAATAARAAELGGTILTPAMDVMDHGRMAILQDPTGGVLSIWQDGSHKGAELRSEPVSLAWVELATADTAAAQAFYTGLFGWDAEHSDTGGMPYTTFSNAGRQVAGMYDMKGQLPDGTPPHWLVYFAVADADGVAAATRDAGGAVMTEPFDIPGVGRIAILADPQGAMFGIVQGATEG